MAAQNDPNRISDFIASLIVMLFSWIVWDDFFGLWQDMKKLENETAKLEGKLNGTGAEEKELNAEETLSNIKMSMRKNKFKLKLLSTFAGLIFLVFTFKQGINSEINTMNVSFQNDLTILSVNLSDTEIRTLRANWIQMKSLDDYIKIKTEIAGYYKKIGENK